MFTTTFDKLTQAYIKRYRFIISKGGSRSGKTYAELQLLDLILQKPKRRVVTTVSHSLPHLLGGAIRDYDNILSQRGIIPDTIRTKNPYIYAYDKSIHEFIGFDRPGKALGAARDILFINEANKMPWEIVHQLIIRTTETIFIDYNPSNEYWLHEQGIINRSDAIVLTSTFRDNYSNLTDGQIADFLEAKQKHDEEKKSKHLGYWYNWWRVYGEGLEGQIDGVIFSNWKIGKFNEDLQTACGLDFGVRDPDAMVEIAIDDEKKQIYVRELLYKKGNSTDDLCNLICSKISKNKLIVADSAGTRTISDIRGTGWNIISVQKPNILESIKLLQGYEIIVSPESQNLINELQGYIWLDKRGEIPIDKNNHLIDALRYVSWKLIKPQIKPRHFKAL